MKKIPILFLGLLMFSSCASIPETVKPADDVQTPIPVTPPAETVPAETLPTESAVTDRDPAAELEEIADRCRQNAAELLKERLYQITGDPVSSVVRYGDVKTQCTIPEKLLYYSETNDDSLFLLVTVPTDFGEIPLLYNAGGMMMLDNPATADRPVPELPSCDYSLTAEPSAAVSVHNIREFRLSYYVREPQLIRITSRQELEDICPMIVEFSEDASDYTYEYTGTYDPERITGWMNLTECYDTSWFDAHDLWIALETGGSSTPDLYAEVNGNSLSITYEYCEIVTDDIIGRQVLIEVSKGDILTCEDTDGRYHTPETYARQTEQQTIADCYEYAVSLINRDGSFVTEIPGYHWTSFDMLPEEYHSDEFRTTAEELNLAADTPVLQMELTANTGTYTAYFTKTGGIIGIRGS